MNSRQKFILLTTQRTGSTAFRLLLNSHENIRCHDEVLLKESGAHDALPHFVSSKSFFNKQLYKWLDYHGHSRVFKRLFYKDIKYRDTLVHTNNFFTRSLLSDFFRSLFNNPKHSGPWISTKNWNDYHTNVEFEKQSIVGFNVMYYELQNTWLRDYIKNNDFKIVHLIRKNKLERVISRQLAKARNNWHSESGTENVKIDLNMDNLISGFRTQIEEDNYWQNYFSGDQYIQVLYESFKDNAMESVRPVINFFGLPEQNLETPLKKISGKPSEVLNNMNDVIELLTGTEYEDFLMS